MNIKKFLILSTLGLGTASLGAMDGFSEDHIRRWASKVYNEIYDRNVRAQSCPPGSVNPRVALEDAYIRYFSDKYKKRPGSFAKYGERGDISLDNLPDAVNMILEMREILGRAEKHRARVVLDGKYSNFLHPWEDTKSA